MITLGLTGSAAMGKSVAADIFRQENIPVFDADAEIHKLFSVPDVILDLNELFPGVVKDGVFDKDALRDKVFNNHEALNELERYLHPLLREVMKEFISDTRASIVLLDIPLLFEVGFDTFCDHVCVVDAPKATQMTRLKARKWSDEQIEFVLSRQMPNEEKCERADYVIPTGKSMEETGDKIREIIKELA